MARSSVKTVTVQFKIKSDVDDETVGDAVGLIAGSEHIMREIENSLWQQSETEPQVMDVKVRVGKK